MTPVQVSNNPTDMEYAYTAGVGSPPPADATGGCCVIDECAGITLFNTTTGAVNVSYHEYVQLYQGMVEHDFTGYVGLGIGCGVATPGDVYGISTTYHMSIDHDLPGSLPQTPDWRPPYVASPGDLSLSISSVDVPASASKVSFRPTTWRLVSQTVSVDKVCAEQQLMQGHATVSFVKTDGTTCTVTIYSQGTRSVAAR
jgi:hypothetical protein